MITMKSTDTKARTVDDRGEVTLQPGAIGSEGFIYVYTKETDYRIDAPRAEMLEFAKELLKKLEA